MRFRNRTDAGRRLADRLADYRGRNPVVLALPRGGVPVGYEIAEVLDAPLDVLWVRKIGVPFQPELALGAIVDGDHPDTVIDERMMAELDIPESYVREESARQLAEIERRRKLYRGDRAAAEIGERTVIVVDDGIATGATMRVALRALARRSPAAIVLAVPVAPPETIAALEKEVDAVVCLAAPRFFGAVGAFYDDFAQVDDATVVALLHARHERYAKSHEGQQP
jgi:putative phosphoribosyl transferase